MGTLKFSESLKISKNSNAVKPFLSLCALKINEADWLDFNLKSTLKSSWITFAYFYQKSTLILSVRRIKKNFGLYSGQKLEVEIWSILALRFFLKGHKVLHFKNIIEIIIYKKNQRKALEDLNHCKDLFLV